MLVSVFYHKQLGGFYHVTERVDRVNQIKADMNLYVSYRVTNLLNSCELSKY